MSTNKHIEKICCVAVIFALLATILFMNGEALGLNVASKVLGYETRLFNTNRVHTIDIVMKDWDGFLETCENEEYTMCNVVIDGEAFKNIGIRAKGNTSLSNVSRLDSDRYSFKLEFDHYDTVKTYHGLDKLNLNNLIQDNTMMKDFLAYQMMREFGVEAPLCSFVYITVNGEDWGLYLAVEEIEDGFLQRNYGKNSGDLYKPDSLSFGDGMGSSDVKLQYIDDNPSSYSNIFDNAKTDIDSSDQTRLIEALKILGSGENTEEAVDIESVIRYFVVHNFVVNGDSYTGSMIHNYYLYEKDGLLSMIPWDYNLAFGTFSGENTTSAVNAPIDSPVSEGSMDDRPMIAWIFADEKYTKMYHAYFSEFLTACFASGYVEELVDTTTKLIAPYVEKDPTKFCTYEEFEKGAATIKEFCLLRAESVQGQLSGEIPSTSTGQKSDSSMQVDASSISLSDMGNMGDSMGGGMGPGFGSGMDNGMQRPSGEGLGPGFGADFGEPHGDRPPEMPAGNTNQMPPQTNGNNSNDITVSLFAVSVIALLLGIFAVYKFKR